MGQNHTVIVLSDLWNKNLWTLWDDLSVLIAIKEAENLWLEIKRYQTSVINDQQNLSVAEKAFNWFYQCASVCVYIYAPDVHMQSVMMYRLYMCAYPYIISAWWIRSRAIRGHTLGDLVAGSGGWPSTSPWSSLTILGCVSSQIPSLCLILTPTHRLMSQPGLGPFSSPRRCLMLRAGASPGFSPSLPCSWLGDGGGMGPGCEVLLCCPGRGPVAPSPKKQPTHSGPWH